MAKKVQTIAEVEKSVEVPEVVKDISETELKEFAEYRETIAKKAEIRAKVEEKTREFNEARMTGKFDIVAKLDDEIKDLVGEYTSIARDECYDALKKTENPMVEACKQMTFPTIRVKDSTQGEEKIPVRTIEDCDRDIDLLKLHAACPGGIGARNDWNGYVERMNFLMTAWTVVDLGGKSGEIKKLNDSYLMGRIAEGISLGETPTSNTQLLKILKTVVSAMIGENYKPSTHDVNYLKSVYCKPGKKPCTVVCPNHRFMRKHLMNVCHQVITGCGYEVEYVVKKDK